MNIDQPSRTVTCVDCGKPIELEAGVPRLQFICPSCSERRKEEQQNERVSQELSRWILPLYMDSDRSRMNAKILECVDNFDLDSGKGLYLSGPVSRGKTRGAVMLLERFCRRKRSIGMVRSTQLAKLFATQFRDEKAEGSLETLNRVRVLLIDDIGKEKATERYETELFDLLEERTASCKTTLYTSNLPLSGLHKTFSDDHALPIVRRIREFSELVAV